MGLRSLSCGGIDDVHDAGVDGGDDDADAKHPARKLLKDTCIPHRTCIQQE